VLFLGHPRDCTRANVEAVATDGAAHLGAIGVVQIRVANEVEGVGATKSEAYCPHSLQVVDNTDGSGPMFRHVAIHKGGQAPHSKGDIRVGPNSDVVECANKCAVGGPCLPLNNFRGNRDGFVRTAEYKASNHRGFTGMCLREVELVHDLVDKRSLG